VAPTSVADELAAAVATHLDALTAISERALPLPGLLAKPIHLGGPAELTALKVLPALAGLVNRGLKVRVTHGLAEELLSGLAAARFDVVISTIRPRTRTIRAVPLTDEELVLVAAPSWSRRLDPVALAQDPARALRGAPLVAYAEDLPLIRRYWRSVFGVRVAGSAAVVVPSLWGVLASTMSGVGISVLPRYLCERELAVGALVEVLSPELPPINTLYFATRTGTGNLPTVAAVRSRLLDEATRW
jgi:DNA-binding transcriptional LysR family regulator